MNKCAESMTPRVPEGSNPTPLLDNSGRFVQVNVFPTDVVVDNVPVDQAGDQVYAAVQPDSVSFRLSQSRLYMVGLHPEKHHNVHYPNKRTDIT